MEELDARLASHRQRVDRQLAELHEVRRRSREMSAAAAEVRERVHEVRARVAEHLRQCGHYSPPRPC